MKISKIGTFDKHGYPTGWEFYGTDMKEGEYCLGLMGPDNSIVCVNGIEIVEWTETRKRIMEEGAE